MTISETSAGLSLGIVVRDTTMIRPGAHESDTCEIGYVRLGDIFDESVSIQSTSVDQLLALADAFQEAARRLRALKAAQGLAVPA
jgi:hypothetical protein